MLYTLLKWPSPLSIRRRMIGNTFIRAFGHNQMLLDQK